MATQCSVCSHAQRIDIDGHLIGAGRERLSQREVARRYGLARASVGRHAAAHIAPLMAAVQGQVTALHGVGLLTEIASLYERTMRLLSRAENADDLRTSIAAIREARGCIETWGRVGLSLSQQVEDEPADATGLDARISLALEARTQRADMAEVAEAEVVE